jgi:replicative DNA helicase
MIDEIDELFEEIDKGREGESWGYSLGLDKLEDIIDGNTQSTYTTVFAGSGVGKSSLILSAYLYNAITEHLEDDRYKCIFFALEMKAKYIYAKILSTHLFKTYGIRISFKKLLSRKKKYRLPDDIYKKVQECKPWLKKVKKIVHIYDKALNADRLYAIVSAEMESMGKFVETDSRKTYIPNNPKLITNIVIDHGGLLLPSKGRTKKQEIDLSSQYLLTFRNMCSVSPIMIMQANRDQTSMDRRKAGFYLPQMSDIKETNAVYEDSDIVLGIYNPSNDKLSKHNGYDIKQMGDYFRSIVCIKSRYGESNVEDACIYYGDINIWKELPPADSIYDYEKLKDNPDYESGQTVEDVTLNTNKFKFTL